MSQRGEVMAQVMADIYLRESKADDARDALISEFSPVGEILSAVEEIITRELRRINGHAETDLPEAPESQDASAARQGDNKKRDAETGECSSG